MASNFSKAANKPRAAVARCPCVQALRRSRADVRRVSRLRRRAVQFGPSVLARRRGPSHQWPFRFEENEGPSPPVTGWDPWLFLGKGVGGKECQQVQPSPSISMTNWIWMDQRRGQVLRATVPRAAATSGGCGRSTSREPCWTCCGRASEVIANSAAMQRHREVRFFAIFTVQLRGRRLALPVISVSGFEQQFVHDGKNLLSAIGPRLRCQSRSGFC